MTKLAKREKAHVKGLRGGDERLIKKSLPAKRVRCPTMRSERDLVVRGRTTLEIDDNLFRYECQ